MTTDGPRVLVVGAGSIGSRHVRTLAAAGAHVLVTDPDPARAQASADQTSRATAVPFDLTGQGELDGAVIASPTVHHADQADELLSYIPRLLVEKPLAVDSATAGRLSAAADQVAVAYNLRWHHPIRRVLEMIQQGDAGETRAVRLWFGSWLPDWRPHTDHRATYSARRALGGGVLLDAIHELDLVVWLFGRGPHQVVGAIVDRVGPLEIDVEDTVKAVLRTDRGIPVEVSLDYLARRYRRGLEVTGDLATIRLDWARQVIEVEDQTGVRTEPAATPLDASYEHQAQAFVAWLAGGPPMPVDAVDGAASIALTDAIRAAAT